MLPGSNKQLFCAMGETQTRVSKQNTVFFFRSNHVKRVRICKEKWICIRRSKFLYCILSIKRIFVCWHFSGSIFGTNDFRNITWIFCRNDFVPVSWWRNKLSDYSIEKKLTFHLIYWRQLVNIKYLPKKRN